MAGALLKMFRSFDHEWYTREWRHVFEEHRKYLQSKMQITEIEIDKAYEHRGNLYGYLRYLGIPDKYHWCIMRLNDIHDPVLFNEDIREFYTIDTRYIDDVHSQYLMMYETGETTY